MEEAIIKRACKIIDELEVTRKTALSNMQKAQIKQKEQYDKKKTPISFQIGQKVLMKRMETQNWHHKKLVKNGKVSSIFIMSLIKTHINFVYWMKKY